MATPAVAHPGSLWGIDLTSVVSMRDKSRVMAYDHQRNQAGTNDDRADELEQIRTVVLDPGHGGDNRGAIGVAGIPEKRLTLELAYRLRETLQETYPRLRVVMTRYWDTSVELSERADIANLADADLFISLHYNAASHERAVGFETYVLNADEAESTEKKVAAAGPADGMVRLLEQNLLRAHRHDLSKRLAETIQHRFVRHIDSVDRGVKQANFSVLEGADMPSVIVEAGFLTHGQEGFEVLTDEHQSRVIDALVESIESFDGTLTNYLDDIDTDDETSTPDEKGQDCDANRGSEAEALLDR